LSTKAEVTDIENNHEDEISTHDSEDLSTPKEKGELSKTRKGRQGRKCG
jgi:hypothetical protein